MDLKMNTKHPNLTVITGCAGFIGSHATDLYLEEGYQVFGIDKLTYASNKSNLSSATKNSKFIPLTLDICDQQNIERLTQSSEWIINFAAETHVDNSISSSDAFIHSNIMGVQSILEACRKTKTKLLILNGKK